MTWQKKVVFLLVVVIVVGITIVGTVLLEMPSKKALLPQQILEIQGRIRAAGSIQGVVVAEPEALPFASTTSWTLVEADRALPLLVLAESGKFHAGDHVQIRLICANGDAVYFIAGLAETELPK